MKKIFGVLGVVAAMLFFSNEKANAQYGGQGQIDVNVGVGLGSFLSSGATSSLLPIGASVEYGINDNISVGGFFGYSSAEFDNVFYKLNSSYTIIGARAAYHKEFVDGFDTYGGLMLGYNIVSNTFDPDPGAFFTSAASGSYLIYGGYVGARYYFTDMIGAHLELGYGIAIAQLGVSLKF